MPAPDDFNQTQPGETSSRSSDVRPDAETSTGVEGSTSVELHELGPAGVRSPAPVPGGRKRRGIDASRLSLILVAILAGSALFVGGFTLGARVATTPGTPADQESRGAAFWDVEQMISRDFAGPNKPTEDQLVISAIKGMLQSLNDPYSYYEPPADFQKSVLAVGGQSIGVGIQVQLQPIDPKASLGCQTDGNGCELAIVAPIPGSPAALAGIQPGDVILAVDGASLDGLSIDKITAKIKGEKGTPVTFHIQRGSTTLDVTIVRNVFDLPEVDTRVLANGQVDYIGVHNFSDVASRQFDAAVADAMSKHFKNIIIDLRGNGGGYVPSAVKMVSEFISSGPVVYQVDAAGNEVVTNASPGGRATDPSIKLVLLVDGGTASSAEIMSAALHDRGRAELIGQKTFGKGIVQVWWPLPNNEGGIHLTVARWLSPNKTWIQGKGITPDVVVDTSNARAGEDPILDAGLKALGFAPESSSTAGPSPSGSPAATPSPAPVSSPSPQASPTATT